MGTIMRFPSLVRTMTLLMVIALLGAAQSLWAQADNINALSADNQRIGVLVNAVETNVKIE